MDYHSDRFDDFSLMIFKKNKLCALLPANVDEDIIFSHQGLTFGGLLLPLKISFIVVSEIYEAIKKYYEKYSIHQINIKLIPSFYFRYPANELACLLQQDNASVYRRDKLYAIDYSKELQIHKTKIKYFNRGMRLGLEVRKEDDLSGFWNKILIPVLERKHQSKPVHTLFEIQKLKNNFKFNIQQFNVYYEEEILAGITIFENEVVVNSQYAASTQDGEKYRALDFLFVYLINHFKKEGKQFFSMGTVSDESKLGFKLGLLKQKEELGCSLYLQDFYTKKLK